MYGNNYGYYNPTRNIGIPTQPMQMPTNNYVQPVQQPIQSIPSGLQGKIVDNIDAVKVADIPYDGSLSYFPLVDGSAIITRKLGMNGASDIVIYKPVIEENQTKEKGEEKPKYITEDYFSENIKKLDNSDVLNDLLDEIKGLKQEIKDFKNKPKEREK